VNIETAGAKLKQLRLERGISLEQVQKKTKIHLNVLRAIEGDALSDLSPIYLKSFIKIYCNYLGLDVKEFLGAGAAEVKPVLHAKVGRDLGRRSEKNAVVSKQAAVNSYIKSSGSGVKGSLAGPVKIFLKIFLRVILVVITLLLIINLFKFIFGAVKKILPKTSVRQVALNTKAALAPKQIVSAPKTQKAPPAGFVLGILPRQKCWVTLKVDGRLVFHGVLAKGRFESWKAKDKIELSLGDASAVELQVNDQRFPNLGRKGQALRNILINKDGLKIGR